MRRRGLALAALLGLGGCDLAPVYHAPAPVLPASYHGSFPFTSATPADAMPRGAWWTVFHDPTLNRLEASLDLANPTLRAAREAYTQARDDVAEARAGLFPQLGGGLGFSDNKQSVQRLFRGNRRTPNIEAANTLGASMTWEPDFWDRIRNETRAAKANAQAAAADLATARLALEADLANDYMALRGLDAELDVLRPTIGYYRSAVQITSMRLHDKIAAGMDVERARNQLATAQAQLTDARASRVLLVDAIAALAGQVPGTLRLAPAADIAGAGAAPHFAVGEVPEIPASVPSALLQRRPDIAAAERRMAAANAEIGVARAAFYPNITLSGAGGFESNGIDLLSLPNSLWAVGASAVMPLFEGGLRRAELQRNWSVLAETADAYRATVLGAMQQVEDGLALARDLRAEAAEEQQAVHSALQVQSMSLSLYTGGLTDYLNVTVAQVAALSAELQAISVHTRRMQNAVDLIRALGGGWSVRDLPTPSQVVPFNPLNPLAGGRRMAGGDAAVPGHDSGTH